MKSLLSIFFALSLGMLLTWCWSDTKPVIEDDSQIEESSNTWIVKETWLSVCDNYLTTLKCIIDFSTWTTQSNFNNSYESLVQSFKNVPSDQLTQTCTTLSNAVREHPTLLKDYPNCSKL